MISCTEFIPLYSEFFKYLEKRGGREAVVEYWNYISDTGIGDASNPNSLRSFIERDERGPYFGAVEYWNHTLTEEACDLLKIHDFKNHCTYTHMRHCPSRGMLSELKHVEPYYDYCGHCDVLYQRVLEKYGITVEFVKNNPNDPAECEFVFYEKGKKPENVKVIDSTKTVVDMKAADNKYLHRDFHTLGDNALRYCGTVYGKESVVEFIAELARSYYAPLIERVKEQGLFALREWLTHVYDVEEASELLTVSEEDGALFVNVEHSPAISYMRSLGQEPSEYYIEETRTLYATIAEEAGLGFELLEYEPDGRAKYTFFVK